MYPGAALGLGLAYVSGQRSLFLWMPILGALGGIGIGSGGSMSYGILHGYAQADTLVNYAYGFLTLFLQGSAWGTFGGAMIGLVLERKPLRSGEWLGLAASILAGGWFTSFFVVDVLGFQINPPRNNTSITFMGAALGQMIWLILNNKQSGLRGAVLGYVGFGLGMSVGRLLGNVANMMQDHYEFTHQSLERDGNFLRVYRRVHLLFRHGQPSVSRAARARKYPIPVVPEHRLRAGRDPALAPAGAHRAGRQNRKLVQGAQGLRLRRSRSARPDRDVADRRRCACSASSARRCGWSSISNGASGWRCCRCCGCR